MANMAETLDNGPSPQSRNLIKGPVEGTVVQVQTINGDVRFDQSRTLRHIVYVNRPNTTRGRFPRAGIFILAAGGYAGMAVAGLICVVTGGAFAQDSRWPSVIPAFALMGALVALIVAFVTKRRLLPELRHRTAIFVIVGLISAPLAFAVPNERQGELSAYCYFAGAFLTLTVSIIVKLVRRGE
jgi:MFS family permease